MYVFISVHLSISVYTPVYVYVSGTHIAFCGPGDYGERSRGLKGSVIGAWIDFDAAAIGFSVNGTNLGPGAVRTVHV